MMIVISAVVTLLIASVCHGNQTLAMAEAQDDPKLASIKGRISKTTPQGRRVIEKVLRTKVEINGEISPHSLGQITQGLPIHLIGWEASAKRFGRWRIILHYHQDDQKQYYEDAEWEYNPKTNKLLVVEANNPIIRREIFYSKVYKFKERRAKVVVQSTDLGNWSPPDKLYTIIGGRKYFIGYIHRRGAVGFREPMIDPTGAHISYSSNTGGGYEGEGTISFISDVYGKRKELIFDYPDKFLEFNGRYYLLMSADEGDDYDYSFLLYDVNRKEYVVHAKGEIKETRKGVFSYHYYSEGDYIKRIRTVTIRNLVNREAPLKLLSVPRSCCYGLTRRRNIKMFLLTPHGPEAERSFYDQEKFDVISRARTRLLILSEGSDPPGLPDGMYEIYYKDKLGVVRKGDLKPIK